MTEEETRNAALVDFVESCCGISTKLISEIDDNELSDVDKLKTSLRDLVLAYLEKFWGERCPDFEPSCLLCRQWASFDVFFGDYSAEWVITEGNIHDT